MYMYTIIISCFTVHTVYQNMDTSKYDYVIKKFTVLHTYIWKANYSCGAIDVDSDDDFTVRANSLGANLLAHF